jgi:hypothetical protein
MTGGGDRQGATVEILNHPIALERNTQNSGAQRAAEMGAAFTPVEARERETTT